ncbi:YcnI family copper-binding membrane protein [Sabulicella glaciei]|uniref:YcnI family protein n=1 Tax=Sabulicella glaciei TaxID=2984948 RepID=A0ABT3NY77_9PROT|nr:YcnI family protein [Roseococcus sp. MDT2-1-1]MCW8087120.1 YcnI family protein [Roseococcus sp. MDT2-1-1]
MRLILALLGFAALPAAAHVTVQPAEAPTQSYARIAFAVPHGCAGQPTTAIEVTLPEGVASARPMPKLGWEIAIETRALARPVPTGHGLVREAPATISWRGSPLPDDHYEEFVMTIRTPDLAGQALRFAVAQICAGGGRQDWSGEAGSPHPAPALQLVPR